MVQKKFDCLDQLVQMLNLFILDYCNCKALRFRSRTICLQKKSNLEFKINRKLDYTLMYFNQFLKKIQNLKINFLLTFVDFSLGLHCAFDHFLIKKIQKFEIFKNSNFCNGFDFFSLGGLEIFKRLKTLENDFLTTFKLTLHCFLCLR